MTHFTNGSGLISALRDWTLHFTTVQVQWNNPNAQQLLCGFSGYSFSFQYTSGDPISLFVVFGLICIPQLLIRIMGTISTMTKEGNGFTSAMPGYIHF